MFFYPILLFSGFLISVLDAAPAKKNTTHSDCGPEAIKNGRQSSLQAVLEELGYSPSSIIKSMSKSEVVGILGELAAKYVAAKKDNKALFFQILLGSREEIKVLERLLFPLTGLSNPSSRYSRWMIIFLTLPNHPTVATLIKLIKREKFSLDEFAREAQRFYGDDSSAVHGIRLPDISVQEMKDILSANGRKPYPHELRLLTVIVEGGDIIIAAYNSSKNETAAEGAREEDVDEPRCIKLGKVNLAASEYEKKIKTYFFKNAENIESVTHMIEQWGQGFYQITFNTVKNALRGFLKHAVMLGETSPKIFLTDCNATSPREFDSNLANIEDFD